ALAHGADEHHVAAAVVAGEAGLIDPVRAHAGAGRQDRGDVALVPLVDAVALGALELCGERHLAVVVEIGPPGMIDRSSRRGRPLAGHHVDLLGLRVIQEDAAVVTAVRARGAHAEGDLPAVVDVLVHAVAGRGRRAIRELAAAGSRVARPGNDGILTAV